MHTLCKKLNILIQLTTHNFTHPHCNKQRRRGRRLTHDLGVNTAADGAPRRITDSELDKERVLMGR